MTGSNVARIVGSVECVKRRVLFVNENIGGHATMHRAIEESLRGVPQVDAAFVHVPAPGPLRRLVGAPVPGLHRLDLDFSGLRAQLAQSRLVRRELRERAPSFEVLHAYTQHAVLTCGPILREMPSVVSTDCTAAQNVYLLPHRFPGRFTATNLRVVQRLERAVFDSATLVVAQSEWAAVSLRETAGVDDDRLRVIPFGLVPFAAPQRVTTDPPEITFVGTALARKGGDRLLRVWRRALARRCVLNLVTHDQVASIPGVRVYRDIRPGDPRLVDVLARTAVFVLPTEVDKSSYSVLEAMLAGVPVIAGRVGGIPELVDEGVTALLVEPDDDELEAAITMLLDDEPRREAMGRAGRARALERFDARQTTARLLEVLREAMSRWGR